MKFAPFEFRFGNCWQRAFRCWLPGALGFLGRPRLLVFAILPILLWSTVSLAALDETTSDLLPASLGEADAGTIVVSLIIWSVTAAIVMVAGYSVVNLVGGVNVSWSNATTSRTANEWGTFIGSLVLAAITAGFIGYVAYTGLVWLADFATGAVSFGGTSG